MSFIFLLNKTHFYTTLTSTYTEIYLILLDTHLVWVRDLFWHLQIQQIVLGFIF